jgi:hypothetical protein
VARSTSRDEGVNADTGGPGVSSAPNLGAAQQSSNAWLGISERIEDGTNGTRPNSSHAKYGGDMDDGILFKGNSAPAASPKEQNTRDGGEMDSWNASGQYGPGSPNYLAGGYGARENMTYGGEKNRGEYVGDGVGSTPDTDMTQYFISGKIKVQMPNSQFLEGTDEARTGNMKRAKGGLGKGYPRNDSKNQAE